MTEETIADAMEAEETGDPTMVTAIQTDIEAAAKKRMTGGPKTTATGEKMT